MSDIVIYRYHIDAQSNEATIEFRTKDPETGRLDPPTGYARHTVPISTSTIQALSVELTPLLGADIAALSPQVLRSHAVTSELHALREARNEHKRARAALEATREEHAAHLRKIDETKEEILRLVMIRSEHESKLAKKS